MLESTVEFVKDEVEEFVSSESAWLKEEEQGPPEVLESRGLPNHGLADAQFLPRPRVLPQQVGHAEVMPGQAQNLPGSRTSRPRVQPQQKGLADGWGQSRLQQMSPHLRA